MRYAGVSQERLSAEAAKVRKKEAIQHRNNAQKRLQE